MKNAWDMTSNAFRQFIERGRTPVIMQIVPELNGGGAAQGVIDLNAAIVRAGGVSIVVSAGGLRVHEITKAGGTHIALPVQSRNPITMFANIGRLRRLIRAHDVDLVHANSRAPAWSAARAVQGTAARFVTSCFAAHSMGRGVKRFYNGALAQGERVIAASHYLADDLEKNFKVNPSIVRVIHRGVAVEKFHPNSVTPDRLIRVSQQMRIPEGALVVMLPGQLIAAKGHVPMLDAIAALGRRDIFCLFVGSEESGSDYRRTLEKYILDKDLGAQARVVTDCNDMPAAYMISTVVVSPSVVPEGFGRVAVEAQAMGRPLIASDHGGTREALLRDETGWLVPPGDVAALTRALDEAINLDARGRAAIATRAMSHVATHFTSEQMCQETLDVYADLMMSVTKQDKVFNRGQRAA